MIFDLPSVATSSTPYNVHNHFLYLDQPFNKIIYFIEKLFCCQEKPKNLNDDYRVEVLDIPNICLINGETQHLFDCIIQKGCYSNLIKSKVLNYLVTYKWNNYAKAYLIFDMICYFILLIIFTINVIYLYHDAIDSLLSNKNLVANGFKELSILIIAFSSLMIWLEIRKILKSKFLGYFSHFWNIFQFISLTLILTCAALDLSIINENYSSFNSSMNFHAISFIIVWSRFLGFFTYFAQTNFIIFFFENMIVGLRYFIFIMFWSLLGFAFAGNLKKINKLI